MPSASRRCSASCSTSGCPPRHRRPRPLRGHPAVSSVERHSSRYEEASSRCPHGHRLRPAQTRTEGVRAPRSRGGRRVNDRAVAPSSALRQLIPRLPARVGQAVRSSFRTGRRLPWLTGARPDTIGVRIRNHRPGRRGVGAWAHRNDERECTVRRIPSPLDVPAEILKGVARLDGGGLPGQAIGRDRPHQSPAPRRAKGAGGGGMHGRG